MAKSLQVKKYGFDRIAQLLEQLPENLRRKALKDGLRKGSEVIADEARRLVAVDTGQLRDSIRVRPATKLRNKATAVGYRVVAGDGDYKGDTFYGSFLEYGFWKQPTYIINNRIYSVKRGRGNAFATWEPLQPFMRPALERKAENAVIICAWAIRAQVEELVNDTRPVAEAPVWTKA